MAKNKINSSNQLRIIAGKWRGRKLTFPDAEGLRPTPDRVRETIFNWLQPHLGFSNCLDLFAGSGALGFEAASRGAQLSVLVEQNSQASKQLLANCDLLKSDQCRVVSSSAQQFLANNNQQFDIVFIDPPYQANLWTEIATKLEQAGTLADNAIIYLECPSKGDLPDLPSHWTIFKDKKAGEVRYCLFSNQKGDAS